METEGTGVSKILDETVHFQSEKTQEWIQEIGGERLQGITESASSAPRLTNPSAALFLERNECPEIHCNRTVTEEREDCFFLICQRV